jgi:hypothetical protein
MLTPEKFDELYQYLKHDKSTNTKKAEKLCEYFNEYSALEAARHKINAAIDHLRTMTISALENDEGVVNIKDLVDKVSNIKAIRDARGEMRAPVPCCFFLAVAGETVLVNSSSLVPLPSSGAVSVEAHYALMLTWFH